MFAFICVVVFFFSDPPQREDRWCRWKINEFFDEEREEEDKEFELHEENDPLRDLSLLLSLLVQEEEEEKVKGFVVVNAKGVMFDRFFVQTFPLFFFYWGPKKTTKTLNQERRRMR